MEIKNSIKLLKDSFYALIHIKATFNNVLISITDLHGNVLFFESSGVAGFKGSKRSTPFAAQVVAESLGQKMLRNGIHTAKVFVKGIGKGRNSAILGFKSTGIIILSIVDITNMPHNGCRLKKQRRI